jgi:hypothetical protein
MKLRGDHPVVLEHPDWWIDANDDPETAAIAQAIRGQLGDHGGADDGPTTADGLIELSRDDIVRLRKEWLKNGGKREWELAGCSEATFYRRRRALGLLPWPRSLQR